MMRCPLYPVAQGEVALADGQGGSNLAPPGRKPDQMTPSASYTVNDEVSGDHECVVNAKTALRAEMLDRRKTLHAADINAGDGLKDQVLAVTASVADKVVAGYVALKDELDPGTALKTLEKQGARLALPVAGNEPSAMIFRQWSPGDTLAKGPFGTVFPVETAAVVEPDIVLVPLVAFDRAGYRLGFGLGYYDRTVRALRCAKNIVAYGIAFDGQEVKAVPRGDRDERLDGVITPTRFIPPSEQ